MKLFLNCDDNSITYNKKNYLVRAAQQLGMSDNIVNWNLSIEQDHIDYALNIEPYTSLLQGHVWTGIWNIDLLIDKNWKAGDWSRAHTCFCAINFLPPSVVQFKDKVRFLTYGVDYELHRRIPTIAQKYNFVTAMTRKLPIYKERDRLIDILSEKFGNHLEVGTGMRPDDYVEVINQGKVQFVRSMGYDCAMGELTQRLFECLLISPVLAHKVPDIEQLGLVDGQDFMLYKTDEELIEKMAWLLKHDDKRQKMTEFATQKVMMYHTYQHRLLQIFQTIEHESIINR
jgi:hypothetical protein